MADFRAVFDDRCMVHGTPLVLTQQTGLGGKPARSFLSCLTCNTEHLDRMARDPRRHHDCLQGLAMCEHRNFHANVGVARLEDTKQFMAEITVHCMDCGKPFQFLGLEAGIDTQGAKVSVDGLEARIAICPEGAKPSPLQRMAFGIEKFDG